MKRSFSKHNLALILVAGVLFTGCSDPLGISDDKPTLDWKGDYLVEGTWDLSSPFSSNRSFGDAFAELLTSKIVSSAGVPSAVTEEAEELVMDLIGEKVRSGVDAEAPDHLKPGSDLMNDLSETMGSVRVISEISLEEGSLLDDLAGTEKIVSFEFSKGNDVHVLTPDLLAEQGVPNFTIEADWEGTEDGTALSVDEHPFELRYGNIISWLLLNVLTDHNGAELANVASGTVGCPGLVASFLDGSDGLFVEAGGEEYGLTTSGLESACESAIGNVSERAVGFFSLDAKVAAGGGVNAIDDDGDGVADRLMSATDYGGFIGVAPEPIAPRLGVTFEATRK